MALQDMRDGTSIAVKHSLVPNDLPLLVLIYLYCYEETSIPSEVLLRLITPALPTRDFNPILDSLHNVQLFERPLLFSLQELVDYLIATIEKELIASLLSHLISIEKVDDALKLIETINDKCVVGSYRELRTRASSKNSPKRRVVRTSFVGAYIQSVATRHKLSDFDDREDFWCSYRNYLQSFKATEQWVSFQQDLKPAKFFFIQTGVPRSGIVSHLKQMTEEDYGLHSQTLVLPSQFQTFLNWYLYRITNSAHIDTVADIEELISRMSLSDISKFPSIHLIRYFRASLANNYQAALDTLHNYFDYMLTQHGDDYFHISLFCLATFHVQFHECVAAVKAFKEATKIARENKDASTLHLIMIWIVNFIEEHPEYAGNFEITMDQIVRYLKSLPDTESSIVFENAYKFELLLLMLNCSPTPKLLESAFKYMAISLQMPHKKTLSKSVFSISASLWKYLGCDSLAKVYEDLACEPYHLIKFEIKKCEREFSQQNYESGRTLFAKLSSPRLSYWEAMNIRLLEVRYLIAIQDYPAAAEKISAQLDRGANQDLDILWKYKFELQKGNLWLKSGMGIRFLQNMVEMLDKSVACKCPKQSAEILAVLCEILLQSGRSEKAKKVCTANLSLLLQYTPEDSIASLLMNTAEGQVVSTT